MEQKLYRIGKEEGDRGIGIFARVSSSPSDRNLIDLYADGGVEFVGLSDKRPNDKFGVAFGYTHVSSRVRRVDADFQALMGLGRPARTKG